MRKQLLLILCVLMGSMLAHGQSGSVDAKKPALESTREESLEAQLLMAKISSERNRLDSLNAQIVLAKQEADRITGEIKKMDAEFPQKMNAIKKRLGIKEAEFDAYDAKLKDDGSVIVFALKSESVKKDKP